MAKYAQLVATGLPSGVLVTIKDSNGRQVSNLFPSADATAPDNRARTANSAGVLYPATYLPNGTYTVAYSGGSSTVVVSGASGLPAATPFDMATQGELDAQATHDAAAFVAHVDYPTGVYATDTAAIQAAHDALPSGGGEIRLARSPINADYNADSIVFTKAVRLVGEGGGDKQLNAATKISTSSATADCLTFTVGGCRVGGVQVRNSAAAPTAGAGIRFTDGTMCVVDDDVVVAKFYDCIVFDKQQFAKVGACKIFDPMRYGIKMSNTLASIDAGDSTIIGTTFTNLTARNPAAAIRWEAGGGLRMLSIKVNKESTGKFVNGVDAAVIDGGGTSVLILLGGSIENVSGKCVSVTQQGTTGSVGKIVVMGTEMGIGATHAVYVNATVQNFISDLHVSGCIMNNLSHGIYAKNVNGVTIGVNSYTPTAVVTNTCVNIDTGCTNVHVEPQNCQTDNVILMTNSAASPTATASNSRIAWSGEREIPTGVTSSVTYTTLYRLTVNGDGSGILDVKIHGFVSGASGGNYVVQMQRAFQRAGSAAVTLTTIGTDVAVGPLVQVSLDVATTTGDIYVKVALPTGGSVTQVYGKCTMRADGALFRLRRGAA